MTCKTVKTQDELDAALVDNDVDCVHIESERGAWLELGSRGKTVRASGSASVTASDSASVTAFGSASVRAYGSASVTAYGSASVTAFGSASVTASDSASVHAYGSASVRASGSASVRAFDSASVTAYGSASVTAYDSASVHAYGSASVTASDSASVTAYDSASVRASDSASVTASGGTKVDARDRSTVQAGPHVAVHRYSARATVTGGVLIDLSALDLHSGPTWCDHGGVEIFDGRAVLYKALDDDMTTGDDYGEPINWAVGAEVACSDWSDNNDCGGGLHLSPTPAQATYYRESATRWLRCTAPVDSIRPILGGVAKCKVPAVRVEAEVDIHGRDVKTLAAAV